MRVDNDFHEAYIYLCTKSGSDLHKDFISSTGDFLFSILDDNNILIFDTVRESHIKKNFGSIICTNAIYAV